MNSEKAVIYGDTKICHGLIICGRRRQRNISTVIELSQNNRHGSALENKAFERIHTHYAYLISRLGKSFKNCRNKPRICSSKSMTQEIGKVAKCNRLFSHGFNVKG